ncbi:MAG: DUF3106 domain-containing protein [Cephaloticoccus sp.]|nr:DUF3106 domain-containing protein [Cephaloticoccus sp.]MCF7761871.1 DUF3106 domain-containing protein [Cephaloticoccus sp.]
MKTSMLTFFLTVWLTTGSLTATETAATQPAATPPAEKEMAALEHFLDLTNDDLDQMQRVITRIRSMGPEERAALRREIEKFRGLPEAQRRNLRQGWGAMNRDLQEGWRQMMQAATPEQRAEIQAKLQAEPPEGKAALRRQLVEDYLQRELKK